MEIKAIGVTTKTKTGDVVIAMKDPLPEDCVIVFLTKKDFASFIKWAKKKNRR